MPQQEVILNWARKWPRAAHPPASTAPAVSDDVEREERAARGGCAHSPAGSVW